MKEKQHLSGSQSTYLWLYVPVAEGWGLGVGGGCVWIQTKAESFIHNVWIFLEYPVMHIVCT